MQSIGCNATADGNEVARNSDIIILATKPDGVGKALTDAKPFITKEKLVISICAGVSVEITSAPVVVLNHHAATFFKCWQRTLLSDRGDGCGPAVRR